MTEGRTTPELRFKDENGNEFPEWEEKKLSEAAEVVGGGTPDTANQDYWGGSINWFAPAEITKAGKYVSRSEKTITDAGLQKSSAKLLPAGSILLTTRATLGNMAILTEPAATNQGFQSLVPKEHVALGEYLYYLGPKIKEFSYKKASGSTFLEISKTELSKMQIPLPSLPEQKKIAEFFSLLDERISKQADKVASLREYKKGLSQRIFSRELRFKDENGEDYPEWEEKKLGEVASILRGNGFNKASRVPNGKNELIVYGELFTKYSTIAKEVNSRTNESGKMISKYGDILMPTSDVTPDGLATATALLKSGVYLGSDMNVIRLKSGTLPEFLSCQINFAKSKIVGLVSGTTVKHIYPKDIEGIKYDFPSLPEQKKIAALLLAMDSKIAKEEEKLAALREQKRGLMQRMFT